MYSTEDFRWEYGIRYMKIIENQGQNNRNAEVEGPWHNTLVSGEPTYSHTEL